MLSLAGLWAAGGEHTQTTHRIVQDPDSSAYRSYPEVSSCEVTVLPTEPPHSTTLKGM